jgi:hypothetical protein
VGDFASTRTPSTVDEESDHFEDRAEKMGWGSASSGGSAATVGTCLGNFLNSCLNEVHEESSTEWGESSGLPVNDVQTLARTSETEPPSTESRNRIVFVVARSGEQQSEEPFDTLATTHSDRTINQMSVPVAVDLLEQWITEIVETQSPDTETCQQPNALKVVLQRSIRKKLRRTPAEACTICLDNFRRMQPVRSLPCSHILHDWCCRKYFRTAGVKPLCPVCRFDMASEP